MRLIYVGCKKVKDQTDDDLMIYHFIPVKEPLFKTQISITWFNIGGRNIMDLLEHGDVEWRKRVDVHLPYRNYGENEWLRDKYYFNCIDEVYSVLHYGFSKYKKEMEDK